MTKKHTIKWDGPFNVNKVLSEENIGLYQIYGTHSIYGRNVLLYIGMTDKSYKSRFAEHYNSWIKYDYDEVQVYLGNVIDEANLELTTFTLMKIEKLLIYFCAPAYNSQNIFDYRKKDVSDLMIMNIGKIASLPAVVSSEWYDSKHWDKI